MFVFSGILCMFGSQIYNVVTFVMPLTFDDDIKGSICCSNSSANLVLESASNLGVSEMNALVEEEENDFFGMVHLRHIKIVTKSG